MPGWKRHNRAASAVLCWLVAAAGGAAEPPADRLQQQPAVLPEAFLVFLGEWDNQRGSWQDPLEFEDPEWRVLDNDAERHDETD